MQEHNLSLRVAALDPKPDAILVSHVTNPSSPYSRTKISRFRYSFLKGSSKFRWY